MTKKDVRDRVKALGLRARWNSDYQEWTVYKPGTPADEHYHTDDDEDAVDTAEDMARRYGMTPNNIGASYPQRWESTIEVETTDERGVYSIHLNDAGATMRMKISPSGSSHVVMVAVERDDFSQEPRWGNYPKVWSDRIAIRVGDYAAWWTTSSEAVNENNETRMEQVAKVLTYAVKGFAVSSREEREQGLVDYE